MTQEDVSVKLAELEMRCKSLSHRVDTVEGMQQAISDLAKSVEVIATKQDYIAKQTGTIAQKVEVLEREPGKKWGEIVRTIITALASAVVTFAITKIFT